MVNKYIPRNKNAVWADGLQMAKKINQEGAKLKTKTCHFWK